MGTPLMAAGAAASSEPWNERRRIERVTVPGLAELGTRRSFFAIRESSLAWKSTAHAEDSRMNQHDMPSSINAAAARTGDRASGVPRLADHRPQTRTNCWCFRCTRG